MSIIKKIAPLASEVYLNFFCENWWLFRLHVESSRNRQTLGGTGVVDSSKNESSFLLLFRDSEKNKNKKQL